MTSGPSQQQQIPRLRNDVDFSVTGQEVPIVSVPWRNAVDVWMTCPSALEYTRGLIVRLYAIAGTTRVLLATNTYNQDARGQYMLGARGVICDHFEVSVQNISVANNQTAPGDGLGKLTWVAYGDQPDNEPRALPRNANWGGGGSLGQIAGVWPLGGIGEFGTDAAHTFPGGLVNNFLVYGGPTNTSGFQANLVEITGYWTGAALAYFQLYDTILLPPIANGLVPVYDFPVQPGQVFSYTPKGGYFYRNGIVWQMSSTPHVMTAVAGASAWADASFYSLR